MARPRRSAGFGQEGGKPLLRFIACGSVDDGKSTLIGRLLHDADAILEDQLAALRADSTQAGGQSAPIDFALLLDGLAAEREQGITIDVAYRYFSTPRRKFIVADAPGHEQYTRNMATGASTADLALVLVDARKGVLVQTRRHSYIAALLGIRQVVLAVNKMDLVDFSEARFAGIVAEYDAFAGGIGLDSFQAIPLCALGGDNVDKRSAATLWYEGPTLLEQLEQAPIPDRASAAAFRMPVQWVNRPNSELRGFCGLVAAGSVRAGDPVRIARSGSAARVARLVAMGGDPEVAVAGQSAMLTLDREIDCSRGDVIAAADDPPEVADQFEATLIWMAGDAMLPGRRYWLKLGADTVNATVTDLKYRINVNTHEHLAARKLELNDIGVANLALDRPIAFEPYRANRDLGGFILIDRISNATVAAGMIHFALRRSHNIHWQHLEVTREAHAAIKGQQPKVLWFTGLSGAGKSTIANLVEKRLHSLGRHTCLLDGDNLRHGLNKDLGFTDTDRVENIRRVGEVARLMADAGLIVLIALISPFRAERRMVRAMFPAGEFVEIYVEAPLAEVEKRDSKGLYAKARRGEIRNFTGIDSPYEPPEWADIHIDTMRLAPAEAAAAIVEFALRETGDGAG
jgi:bifunctional enzyme CysN/CysC